MRLRKLYQPLILRVLGVGRDGEEGDEKNKKRKLRRRA